MDNGLARKVLMQFFVRNVFSLTRGRSFLIINVYNIIVFNSISRKRVYLTSNV